MNVSILGRSCHTDQGRLTTPKPERKKDRDFVAWFGWPALDSNSNPKQSEAQFLHVHIHGGGGRGRGGARSRLILILIHDY